MRVAVTYPKVNNVNGTMRPRLERSGVQRVRAIATFHRITNTAVRIVNLHTGASRRPPLLTPLVRPTVRRSLRTGMSSCAPGSAS